MTRKKESPRPVGAGHMKNLKISVPLYSSSQKMAQAVIFRRFRVSRFHAIIISNLLNLGGSHD